ncbi:hypothetical protein DFH07DRAFT_954670 [Mycena maculata]|uniref:Uncharacterized protein n=1 Tax=Mycena maculata TaxID=230809 RepID=A0AAD7NNY2_9AGAR|nr:hypothetical protein DFH07DRAFT_954670 [Mycena maculata]
MYLYLVSMQLASLALGSIFYGMYAVLFCVSMFLLVGRHNSTHTTYTSRENGSAFTSMVFVSATILFLVVTLHWTTLVYRTFVGFVSFRQGTEAEVFFADQKQPTQVGLNCLFALSIPIGDSLIIHRLWVVWAYSRSIVVVPAISTIILTISGFVATYNNWLSPDDVFSNPWVGYGAVMTLLTNFYCTVFITWKIWAMTRRSMPVHGTNLRHFLVILVESAGLYTCIDFVLSYMLDFLTHNLRSWALVFVVTYQIKSLLQLTLIQAAPPLVGLVNALIHTRVGLGWTSEQMESKAWPASPVRIATRV